MQTTTLTASVGVGGANHSADVIHVQKLLNVSRYGPLELDGICGKRTIEAIISYQAGIPTEQDGFVEPRGLTYSHLRASRRSRSRLRLGPLETGEGYYSYRTADRQYGTPATIHTVRVVAREFSRQFREDSTSAVLFGVGDISLLSGCILPPHQTHRSGRDVDIRPVRRDGLHRPVMIGDAAYSRVRTAKLVGLFLDSRNVEFILFNDLTVAGVVAFAGHNNHLHIRMRS